MLVVCIRRWVTFGYEQPAFPKCVNVCQIPLAKSFHAFPVLLRQFPCFQSSCILAITVSPRGANRIILLIQLSVKSHLDMRLISFLCRILIARKITCARLTVISYGNKKKRTVQNKKNFSFEKDTKTTRD